MQAGFFQRSQLVFLLLSSGRGQSTSGTSAWKHQITFQFSLPCFGHYCMIPSPDSQPCARCAAATQLPCLQEQGKNTAPVLKVKAL